jgi:16S rRNA (uracil1498-N3)-methyltransferase
MPGFYLPELTKADKFIQIYGPEYHHLVHVRRLQKGDRITVTSGTGLLATALVKGIHKNTADLEILKIEEIQQSYPRIAVAFSLLKSKNDQVIIEKLTELGIKEFFPLITSRSVRKTSPNTVKKFNLTAIAAIKQCDNAYLPVIHKPTALAEALKFIEDRGFIAVVALESGERRSLNAILKHLDKQEICLIIGPEGGFSPEEIRLLKAKKISPVTLGNHILRAETAAITAAAQAINYFLEQDPGYY